jgi:hypothetical protein
MSVNGNAVRGPVVCGMEFPVGSSEIDANLWMFSRGEISPNQRFDCFKRAVDLAFNCEGSIREVVWNEWTEWIVRELIGDWSNHQFLSLAGCSSSGKSDAVALYGLMSYWSRPTDTYFIVMSTTKLSARGRIWKSINQFWSQAVEKGCPGKLIDSDGYIKGINAKGQLTRNSGIILMAAGGTEAATACKDLQGLKNPNFLVAADEFAYLGEGILRTSRQNLTSNERLTFCGMSNPDRISDSFGDLSEPENGWKSITEEDESWKTKYGRCIRLNAEKSPRIMNPDLVDERGRHKYFWQPNQELCDLVAEERGGKDSRGYYQFIKAFWCPDGATNSIYSELEFLNHGVLDQDEPAWDDRPIVLTALDESFSREGDRSFCAFARLGKVNSVDHLHFCYEGALEEDVNNKETPHTFQIVDQWMKLAGDFGVNPNHAIMDNTGGGQAFGHIVDKLWSPAVQKVNFQGKASDRTVVFREQNTPFYNKNSELWIQPKEFIRGRQISGLSKETMAELIEREYHKKEIKALRVESKEEAKKRLKRSPDRADVFNMLVEKAITLGRFNSFEVKQVARMVNNGWAKAGATRALGSSCGRKMRIG